MHGNRHTYMHFYILSAQKPTYMEYDIFFESKKNGHTISTTPQQYQAAVGNTAQPKNQK